MAETDTEQAADAKPAAPVSKLSRKFTSAVCLLLVLAMCVYWLVSSYNTRNLLQQQADGLGQTLAQQTATQLTELVLANDLISMNVVLSSLTADASIEEITVLGINNNVIASASSRAESPRPLIPLPLPLPTLSADYRAEIALPDSVLGAVQIRLNLDYIEVGSINNLLLICGVTLLLILLAVVMTSTYFQYLVTFPSNLLSFALSNIRQGNIETCPEPDNNNELSHAIRQYNTTAEFLAQNAFLDNFGNRQPVTDPQQLKIVPGQQDVSLLIISMANYQYLASTLQETVFVRLLNRFYFFVDKVSQLLKSRLNRSAEATQQFDSVLQFPGSGKIFQFLPKLHCRRNAKHPHRRFHRMGRSPDFKLVARRDQTRQSVESL